MLVPYPNLIGGIAIALDTIFNKDKFSRCILKVTRFVNVAVASN